MSEEKDEIPHLDVRMGQNRKIELLLRELFSGGMIQSSPAITLLDTESSRMPEEPDISDRVSHLEGRLSVVANRVTLLESQTRSQNNVKEQALVEYQAQLAKIPEVHSAYAFDTPAGMDIWTLHTAKSTSRIIDRISEAQITLDKRFPTLYFDFNLLRVSEVSEERLAKARRFYERR